MPGLPLLTAIAALLQVLGQLLHGDHRPGNMDVDHGLPIAAATGDGRLVGTPSGPQSAPWRQPAAEQGPEAIHRVEHLSHPMHEVTQRWQVVADGVQALMRSVPFSQSRSFRLPIQPGSSGQFLEVGADLVDSRTHPCHRSAPTHRRGALDDLPCALPVTRDEEEDGRNGALDGVERHRDRGADLAPMVPESSGPAPRTRRGRSR